jgi:cyanophycinase-like exopeptidase
MGEWAYSSQGDKPDDPDLDSKTALANPYGPRITLVPGFLDIPVLKGIVTDTHFAKRNRMGRMLLFLARLEERDGAPVPTAPHHRGIGVEERAAVLLEPDGNARVVGAGCAYFVDAGEVGGVPSVVERNKPLTFGPYKVQKVAPGHKFNLGTWSGESDSYTLSVSTGKVRSTQARNAIY